MAVVDFVFAVDSLPDAPEKYRARTAEIIGGGPAANAAVAIARLGGTSTLAARLGNDPLGEMILNELEDAGVSIKLVNRSAGGRSSFSSVYVDQHGERQIMNFRGSGLTDETDWLERAQPANAVLVDPRWPEGASRVLDLAREWGVPGVLDAEAPIAAELLQKSTHVAFSRSGLQSVSDTADPIKALRKVAAALPGWACVTDGANGVYCTGASGIEHVPAFEVPVTDTLAAGDIWHGAFTLALAENHDEHAAIRFANAAAALKCMQFGGRAGCPDRDAVLKFLKEKT